MSYDGITLSRDGITIYGKSIEEASREELVAALRQIAEAQLSMADLLRQFMGIAPDK